MTRTQTRRLAYFLWFSLFYITEHLTENPVDWKYYKVLLLFAAAGYLIAFAVSGKEENANTK